MGLSEAEFLNVPSDILEDLRLLARSWSSSVPVERSFKMLGDSANDSRSGKLSMVSIWHRLLNSPLLPDHTRQQPALDDFSSVTKAATITKNVFVPDSRKFSLGEEALDAISNSVIWAFEALCVVTSWLCTSEKKGPKTIMLCWNKIFFWFQNRRLGASE